MAEKKRISQAEKAAASKTKRKTKNSSGTVKKSNNSSERAIDKSKSKPSQTQSGKPEISIRLISSIACLVLFALFLNVELVEGGAANQFIREHLFGLFGETAFIVSIPVLLYLFFIHAFSGDRPIKMRTICLCCFVIVCGAISHLGVSTLGYNASVTSDLYNGGITGSTGGVICGGIAMLLTGLFERVFTYIILIVSALLLLLGGMHITIPSIIRAVKERPRADWDEEEQEEYQDPATVVVNHLTNKRIAYLERKRQNAADETPAEAPAEAPDERSIDPDPELVIEPYNDNKPVTRRAKEILQQIDGNVEEPVAVSAIGESKPEEAEILPVMNKPSSGKPNMPPLLADEPIAEDTVTEDITPEVKEIEKPKVTSKEATEAAADVAAEIEKTQAVVRPVYTFPPIDLLKLPGGGLTDGTNEMRENSRRLNETLASFKIEARIVNVTRGPSVTRYEVELEKGVRLNKITTAADDIALSLGASGVRIAAIPGKISVVGIEVPNRAVNTVSLREVIDSNEFTKAKSKSSFAVGKDIGGSCIVGNIAKLPHMLIAGTTGSGKSVCMNSIIISLLYKASPDDVKLIMVDPKMVELGIYNDIPHLLIPVVTDPKKAAGSLQWAVTEMMRRYKAMSDAGVRDLESYNSIIEGQEIDGNKLPQVVVIIDELADLMLVAAKEVEESICRIAQMGRAAGIHLIIATQRPSADVITGLMKANIPSRIAFAVASAMESRIILDTQGAEKLVGKGDMLYAPIGTGKPTRVQGCFVSDAEVEAVASFVKKNFVSNYDQEIMQEIEKKAVQTGNKPSAADPEPSSDELMGDEMLPAAVDVFMETGQASVSILQRRLKLGYARAARIVDEMEEKGIVGPFAGSKPRAILITKEQWEAMKSGQPAQLGFEDMGDDTEFQN